ncbi:MAG: hypothetical protein Q4E88_02880 [Coriobacteriia bacterium]|nr:hypothetical protein [Coriobacteriia bacterium]
MGKKIKTWGDVIKHFKKEVDCKYIDMRPAENMFSVPYVPGGLLVWLKSGSMLIYVPEQYRNELKKYVEDNPTDITSGWGVVKEILEDLKILSNESHNKAIEAEISHVVPDDYQGTWEDAKNYYWGKCLGLSQVVDKVKEKIQKANIAGLREKMR